MIDLAVAEASVPCSLHPLCAHLLCIISISVEKKKKKN